MTRLAIHKCKRRGCNGLRKRFQFLCDDCWGEVSHAEQQRYLKPARARLTRIAKSIEGEILRDLGRKPAPAAAPATAIDPFTNIARLTGDRDAMEPVE